MLWTAVNNLHQGRNTVKYVFPEANLCLSLSAACFTVTVWSVNQMRRKARPYNLCLLQLCWCNLALLRFTLKNVRVCNDFNLLISKLL